MRQAGAELGLVRDQIRDERTGGVVRDHDGGCRGGYIRQACVGQRDAGQRGEMRLAPGLEEHVADVGGLGREADEEMREAVTHVRGDAALAVDHHEVHRHEVNVLPAWPARLRGWRGQCALRCLYHPPRERAEHVIGMDVDGPAERVERDGWKDRDVTHAQRVVDKDEVVGYCVHLGRFMLDGQSQYKFIASFGPSLTTACRIGRARTPCDSSCQSLNGPCILTSAVRRGIRSRTEGSWLAMEMQGTMGVRDKVVRDEHEG